MSLSGPVSGHFWSDMCRLAPDCIYDLAKGGEKTALPIFSRPAAGCLHCDVVDNGVH